MINDNYIEVNKNNVKKFLETYYIEDLEVETQNGWVNVECIGKEITANIQENQSHVTYSDSNEGEPNYYRDTRVDV